MTTAVAAAAAVSNDGGQRRASSSAIHFAAGLSTGILSASLLQPADLLKTRVQQAHNTSLLATLRSITAGPHALRQLWRGTLPSVMRTGLGSALYFTTLNSLRRSAFFRPLAPSSSSPSHSSSSSTTTTSVLPRASNLTNLSTGALARTLAGFALMPLTVLKVRYESNLYAYPSLRAAVASVMRSEGPRGFFTGAGATAVRDAPYAGLYVLFYEQAKRRLGDALAVTNPNSNLTTSTTTSNTSTTTKSPASTDGAATVMLSTTQSAGVNFSAGVLAAGLATALTNPFDAVKTRLQLRPREYGHLVAAARRMVREEGFRSLFDGLGLRMARKAMSSALAWSVYEELVKVAERERRKKRGGDEWA